MNNLFNIASVEISPAVIALNIIFSFLLQMAIAAVYKKTHKGLSYSSSFVSTTVMVGILGTVVMMIVRNNLIGAFALLGAFSMIRFRTILKETRDIAFVFFALVVGIAIGTGNYSMALISTFMVSLVLLALNRFNIGSMTDGVGLILTFNAKNEFNVEAVNQSLSEYLDSLNLLQVRTHGVDINSYSFSIKLKDALQSSEVVKILKSDPLISNVEIITGEHSVEY